MQMMGLHFIHCKVVTLMGELENNWVSLLQNLLSKVQLSLYSFQLCRSGFKFCQPRIYLTCSLLWTIHFICETLFLLPLFQLLFRCCSLLVPYQLCLFFQHSQSSVFENLPELRASITSLFEQLFTFFGGLCLNPCCCSVETGRDSGGVLR